MNCQMYVALSDESTSVYNRHLSQAWLRPEDNGQADIGLEPTESTLPSNDFIHRLRFPKARN